MLKMLPLTAIKYLTNIINKVLTKGYFPTCWKLAKVIVIPKVGKDHTLPDNYRPISLLNTISKMAEKAILLLNKFMNAKQTIRLEQFGFRSAHGTVQQVVRVSDIIQRLQPK
jgi:hypothetical protein